MGTGAACVVYALFHKIKPLARRRRTRPAATHGRSPPTGCAPPPRPPPPHTHSRPGAAPAHRGDSPCVAAARVRRRARGLILWNRAYTTQAAPVPIV